MYPGSASTGHPGARWGGGDGAAIETGRAHFFIDLL